MPGGWSNGSPPPPGFFDGDGEEYPPRALGNRLKAGTAFPALPPPSGAPPGPANSVCMHCGEEVPNAVLGGHVRAHRVPATAFVVPTTALVLPGGIRAYVTSKAMYARFPDGRTVTRRHDGAVFTSSPCPRCRALVDATRPERHVHCAFVNCPTVWDLGASAPRVIAEHIVDDVIWKAHAVQLSRADWEGFVQLLEVRPDVAEVRLATLLRGRGFTVARNSRTGLPCSACGETIAGPVLIEKVGDRWIHVLCPRAIPRPRRLGSTSPTSKGPT